MSELHREDTEKISNAFESAKVLERGMPEASRRPDRKILEDVIRTHTLQVERVVSPVKNEDDTLSEEDKKIVQNLSEKALTNGVRQAVAEAKKTGRAEIVEAFHDWLVDHMYEKLVAAGLIDPS